MMELRIKNISKTYGKSKKALCNVDISLTPGIYGLLGPNGSGKSTLMNIITDNLKADRGCVYYDGDPISKLGSKYREKIGYMPQQQEIYDNFTGEEFLWYMAALKGLEKKYAKNVVKNIRANPQKSQSVNLNTAFLSEELQEKIGKALLDLKLELYKEGMVDYKIKVVRENHKITLLPMPIKIKEK